MPEIQLVLAAVMTVEKISPFQLHFAIWKPKKPFQRQTHLHMARRTTLCCPASEGQSLCNSPGISLVLTSVVITHTINNTNLCHNVTTTKSHIFASSLLQAYAAIIQYTKLGAVQWNVSIDRCTKFIEWNAYNVLIVLVPRAGPFSLSTWQCLWVRADL